MKRTLDPSHLNAVANHPAVRPHIGGGDGELDLTELVGNTANYVLTGEHGGFVAVRHFPGTYEVHTLFTPEGRGAAAMEAGRESLGTIFSETDAIEVLTRVPRPNKAARLFAEANGFTLRFTRPKAWETGADVDYFGITIEQWAMRSDACLAAGRRFHEELEAAKIAAGSTLPTHYDDEAHDRAAGAACLMIAAGNAEKGVAFYNRWARFAGYAEISLIGLHPILIDIQDAVIQVRNGHMEVLSCQ
ncbi:MULTISPECIES: hypothetical protein [Asticcacaulis]|uniref:hypothetical protein n=1 Tax=Asticcacaulis TaxID=76890 RepID=UPI001AE904BE|nr:MULTISPECIES: hypothetical protein [Asticcacaulis]MBP2159547.1 hypothetical protein [Asticcacaulis solisilvae]MDR6800626.1 hypothetical protein [Asticcacaulis sp. BE141]